MRRDAAAGRGAVCSHHRILCDADVVASHGSVDSRDCGGQPHVGPSPRALAGEPCPVCRFLAQKVVPADRAEEATSAPFSQEPASFGAVQGAKEIPWRYLIRGPPAVA
jgi:hypothetical protein